jgi:ketosteroid isomerase-like protein
MRARPSGNPAAANPASSGTTMNENTQNIPSEDGEQVVHLTRRLLEAITAKDWGVYQELTDPSMTSFEPEACGHLVQGRAFHQFYFQLGGGSRPGGVHMVQPHVRLWDNTAIVSYVRLIQTVRPDGPATTAFAETRVWQKQNGSWKHVHFHRSPAGSSGGP